MKLIIFTSRTKHHHYFVQKIFEKFDIEQIIYEKRCLVVPYATGPFFEREQDDYEERFFDEAIGGCQRVFPDRLEKRSIDIHSVNQKGMREYLLAHEPDLIWVYGVGRIHPNIIGVPKWGMVNLHGGISQEYRGLDSTLWALFNKDFHNLGLTVHYVAQELDTGDILMQKKMGVLKSDEIFHYRFRMAMLATETSLELLREFEKSGGQLPAKPQVSGKYYSLMPLEKKWVAYENLKQYKNLL